MTIKTKSRRLINATVAATGIIMVLGSSVIAHAAPNMRVTGYTTQPIGHYNFCKSVPRECKKTTARVAPHHLTRESWANIVDVNNRVNTKILPLTDMEIWGEVEVWSYPTTVGDCEDFVLLKRRELMKTGIASGNLLVTVVTQPNGEGHAVLTVRTDRGDFILDNLVGRVNEWRDTPYTYLKRQASDNAGRWMTIDDGPARVARK